MPAIQRKDLDNTSAHITVTVTREELKPKLDAELKRFRNRAAIKGFRQGQAPMPYIKSMFGTSIFTDIFNDMLSQELYNYLRETKLDVLGQPLPVEQQERYSFKIDNPEPEYKVTYEVGFVGPFDVKGLEKSESFERLTVSNLDELAADDLEYTRKRMGKRSNPENDVQENDILRIAARELDNEEGGIKDAGWETTITVFVKNVVDEAFKNKLLSSKKGDTLRFNARQVEEQKEERMYRKYVLSLPEDDERAVGDWFEGLIEEVSRVEMADLDEAFFNNYFGGSVSSEAEAMEEVKKGIRSFYDVRSNALLMRHFQERLMQLNRIELPDTFLQRWLTVTNRDELSPEAVVEQYPAFAENLRWSLVRDKIKEQFGIVVGEEEIRAEFAQRVHNYFRANVPDNIIQSSVDRLMQNEKDVESTQRDLETDRIFKAIRSTVTVTDKAIPSEEFHKLLDEITKKAEQEQNEDVVLRQSIEE